MNEKFHKNTMVLRVHVDSKIPWPGKRFVRKQLWATSSPGFKAFVLKDHVYATGPLLYKVKWFRIKGRPYLI